MRFPRSHAHGGSHLNELLMDQIVGKAENSTRQDVERKHRAHVWSRLVVHPLVEGTRFEAQRKYERRGDARRARAEEHGQRIEGLLARLKQHT